MSKRIKLKISEADHKLAYELADKFGYKISKFYAMLFDHGLEYYANLDGQAKEDTVKQIFDALKPDYELLNLKKS
jgi:hypothetical protein